MAPFELGGTGIIALLGVDFMLEFLEKTLVDRQIIDDVVIDLNNEFSSELQFSSKLRHAEKT